MKSPIARSLLCLSLASMAACRSQTTAGQPATRKTPVTDTYSSVQVVDQYRWLEDWNDPNVRAWADAQNRYARGILDRLDSRDAIRARVAELRRDQADSYYALTWRNGRLFAMKRQPPKQQPLLIVMESADLATDATTLVDPGALDPTGSTTIDFYEPSPDGSLVAVSLSKGGSESGEVHVFDMAGREVHEVVPRVQGGTAGGDVAWTVDGAGFFYTRYPYEGERPAEDLFFYQQVYFHKLGTRTETDRYELGRDLPRVAEIRLDAHPTLNYVLASVQHGDGGGIEHYLRSPDGTWRRIAILGDRIAKAQFGSDSDLYFVSKNAAPRGKILRTTLKAPSPVAARTIVPESEGAIEADFWESGPSPVITDAGLYVPYQTGGPMELKAFDPDGRMQGGPTLLDLSAVSEMTRAGNDLLFLNVSFTKPPAWYRFDAGTGKTEKTALASPSPFTFDDAAVIRGFATSKDGTRVPYITIRRKDSIGKSIPMIVTGYGGYGVSETPNFNRLNRLLLDQGVGSVLAVIRGGGEFGDRWHEDGRLTKKQNVFDDFAAVLQQLVDRGETSSDRLGIIGGSNGGLLMGATFTQHPNLARAVVSSVGIYDMLRVELSPNGAFNVPEFGTVRDPALFAALFAYSPYHHVQDGTAYPAILFMTGANDPRVDPMQSRKMTARLQASGTTRPVLLRTSGNTGHGIGTPLDERIEQDTDIYSFFFHELGVTFERPLAARAEGSNR
jgi:prolyl oligopeptidase